MGNGGGKLSADDVNMLKSTEEQTGCASPPHAPRCPASLFADDLC